jgi:putative transposase
VLRHTDAQIRSELQERVRKLKIRKQQKLPQAKRQRVEEEGQETTEQTKCQKWRLHPNTDQRRTLKLWMDGARFAYNLSVCVVNRTRRWGRKGLRSAVGIKNEVWEKCAPERLRGVPYKVRDSALLDVCKACAALKAKEHTFKRALHFRTSKDYHQSFAVEKVWLNCKTVNSDWAGLFGTTSDRSIMRTEDGKTLPLVFEHDCRVMYERCTGSYFICIPKELDVRPSETQGQTGSDEMVDAEECKSGNIVSIDPGIRTYATCYDPGRGIVVEWGMTGGRKDGSAKGTELMGWMTRKLTRLEHKAKLTHGRSRKRIRNVAARVRKHIQDLTNELHRQLALWLCRNYTVVLLPKYSVKGISRRKGLPPGKRRLIGRNSVRKMAQMSPFRFRQFLQHKAREYGTRVIICDEYYTSKTCTNCGFLNDKLGGSKTFVCSHCSHVCDRDAGAARNILLRYLSVQDINPLIASPATFETLSLSGRVSGLV